MPHDPQVALLQLFAYCRAQNWAGYDPYDALNSPLLNASPLRSSRLIRLAVTQALKRSPINVRPLLRIPKTQNPKALGLFISALLKAPQLCAQDAVDVVGSLANTLVALRSSGTQYHCWGYSFPWQTRSIVVPRGAANLVCTTFAAQAFLDLYESRGHQAHLDIAVSAAEYILNELYWTDGGAIAGFAYPQAEVRNQVHNANLLAAAVLCRVHRHTGDPKMLEPALRAARCSVAKQKPDGSWAYGEAPTQQWIDNFHTGFNLCALRSIARDASTSEFGPAMRSGFGFYLAHFFRADGAPRYFHNRTYPLDIHAVAQSILTLVAFADIDPTVMTLARLVFGWAMDHMWDDRGFFYYRVLRVGKVRTSYMRWSQAWMLLALAELVRAEERAASLPITEARSALQVC